MSRITVAPAAWDFSGEDFTDEDVDNFTGESVHNFTIHFFSMRKIKSMIYTK